MSDADRLEIIFKREDTYGTAPDVTPNYQQARFVSESLRQDDQTTASATIRSDRQVVDHVRTNAAAAGDIVSEFAYGADTDEWLVGTVRNTSGTWDSAVSNTGTFNAVNATSKFTGTSIEAGLAVNDLVFARGFSATVDGVYLVTAVGANEITVSPTPADVTGDGDEEIAHDGTIINGTNNLSYTFQKEFTDNTTDFARYVGCAFNTLNLATANEDIVRATWGITGQTEASSTTDLDASATAVPTTDSLNSVDHLEAFHEGGATYAAVDLGLTIENNVRGRTQLGALGPQSIGLGKCAVSGTLQAYYSSATLMDKHLNKTASSIAWAYLDAAGNGYGVWVPNVKFLSGQRVAGGENTDIIADMTWAARRSASPVDMTIRFTRFLA